MEKELKSTDTLETDKKTRSQIKQLTVEYVADLLLRKGILTKEQYKGLLVKAGSKRAVLQRHHESTFAKQTLIPQTLVSPAEIIASFDIEMPNSKGRPITEDDITQILAEELNMPYMKLDPLKLNLDIVTTYVPRPFAIRHMIVPVDEKDGIIIMAVADPYNAAEAIESLEKTRKIKIGTVLCSKNDILKTVREFFGFRASISAAQAQVRQSVDLGDLEQYVKLKGQAEIEVNDQHIIRAVDYLLLYAFEQRASDIHVEPKRDKSMVRLRIDGVLHYIHSMPKSVHAPVISRIKMMSRMDIAEKRRPQDGRIKTLHKGKELELRVSTLPVAFGEKVVIRIFDPDVLMQEIEDMGFYPREYALFTSFLKRPNGVILVTGPTGSGKTTTLYSSLRLLSTPEVNIVTIEDPIEMVVEDFNQVGVQQVIGVTFANILRTILRQDPDIIMVGEIRDKETAENAVQSALTGHLVMSTLHTNDAPSSVIRLLDLGVHSFLISSTVIGIMAQRLVRKICIHCKQEKEMTREEQEYLQLKQDNYTIYFGEGCTECRGTGYRGRTGLFEVMDFTENVKAVLTEKQDLVKLYEVAKADGLVTLRQCAIRKLLEGITTYEEVVSVTG